MTPRHLALTLALFAGCGDDDKGSSGDDTATTGDTDGADSGGETDAEPFVLDGPSEWGSSRYELLANTCDFDVEGGSDTGSPTPVYITVEPAVGETAGAFRLSFGAEAGTFDCLLAADGSFSCTPLSTIQDLTNGTGDARFRTDQDLGGTFRSAQRMSGAYTMELSCAGSDCGTYAQYFPYDLPCQYSFSFTVDRR